MSVKNTHFGAVEIKRRLSTCQRLFFIGIGGISMSALARLSAHEGFSVGGSDRTRSNATDALEKEGIAVFFGHHEKHLEGYDAVIYTVAIGEDNPEYRAARAKGIPCISRADYLGYLMTRFERRIGIAGMHGKSTCTAMCATLFLHAGDPTVLCGADMPALGDSPCRIGVSRDTIVFEACEYMDSFLDFSPTLAVILNVGLDHVDYFRDMKQIRSSFLHYAERTGEGGTVLYNADDADTCLALRAFGGRHVTFALDGDADFTAGEIVKRRGMTSFDLLQNGKKLCRVTLPTVGRHNLYNALAAAGAGILSGLTPEAVAAGLAAFKGAKRRMERKGTLPTGAVVYDDYGHHPDEIKATLAGAKEMGFSRILCAYQPHTYSRTAGLLESFSTAFGDADRVFFADIYAAREQNVYGVTSETLAEKVGERALYCGSFAAVAEAIECEAHEGDLVIVMGAGDVFHVFDLLDLN